MITENQAIYFSSLTCSHSAVISGVESPVYGYYGRVYVEYNTERGVVDGYKPVFTCSAAVAASAIRGATVAISTVDTPFKIAHVEPVDDVEARLILVEA